MRSQLEMANDTFGAVLGTYLADVLIGAGDITGGGRGVDTCREAHRADGWVRVRRRDPPASWQMARAGR